MGLSLANKCIFLLLFLEMMASKFDSVDAAGACDAVFKGFSDCLLNLGENMVNYPQALNDRENLQTLCAYWDDFHSCATTALADCQEGATEVWDQLKQQSRSLNFEGSLFELCGGNSKALKQSFSYGVTIMLTALSTLVTWLLY
ncbi:neuritin 1b [Clupea harengus]|uniref:Neuritin 1b n=1 Tax=Clupea harengus TaxID=7950 RepID=A0A6P3VWJ3_CLUHA|nr:neuritin 1b [Clupea harengus]